MATLEQVRELVIAGAQLFDTAVPSSDEAIDAAETFVCLLVPEACVPMMIGKQGANINEIKAASGVATFSFARKDTALRGCRRAFLTGQQRAVARAAGIVIFLINDFFTTEGTGSQAELSVVVDNQAAGAVIGKQGANLNAVREATGCAINIEKSEEALPALCGRVLRVRKGESTAAVMTAFAQLLQTPGFASVTRESANAAYTSSQHMYGGVGGHPHHANPRHGSKMGAPQFGGYGGFNMPARGIQRDQMCSLHGKKRGTRNLTAQLTTGQFMCRPEDMCKGVDPTMVAALNAPDPIVGMGLPDMSAMGNMGLEMGFDNYGQMGGMYGMGGQMGGHTGMPAAMGGMNSNICAVHGKKRGPRNLQPHPGAPGLYSCVQNDECKL